MMSCARHLDLSGRMYAILIATLACASFALAALFLASCSTTSPVYYSAPSPAPSRGVEVKINIYSISGSAYDGLCALVGGMEGVESRSAVLLGDRAELLVALPSRAALPEFLERLGAAGYGADAGGRLVPLAWNREYVFTRDQSATAAVFPCDIDFRFDAGSPVTINGILLMTDGTGLARFKGVSIDLTRAGEGEIGIADRLGNHVIARRDGSGEWYALANGTRDGKPVTDKVPVEALR